MVALCAIIVGRAVVEDFPAVRAGELKVLEVKVGGVFDKLACGG